MLLNLTVRSEDLKMRKKYNFKKINIFLAFLFFIVIIPKNTYAEGLPYLDIVKEASNPTENAFAVKQLLTLSILTLIPSLVLMLTPFVRISIVLSLMRQALGLNSTPSNQALLTLALFMSLISMSPMISEINTNAIEPYLNNKINIEQAVKNADKPIREYMFKQVDNSELSLFINLNAKKSNEKIPKTYSDIPNKVLYPAYMVGEIKKGLFIGIIVSVSFVMIDLATSAILQGMNMMMLSPMVVSGIFKLLLFIFANGFELIIQATMLSIK